MKLLLVLFISVTLLFSSTEFEKTYVVYKSGDFTSSFKRFKTLAEDENIQENAKKLFIDYCKTNNAFIEADGSSFSLEEILCK